VVILRAREGVAFDRGLLLLLLLLLLLGGEMKKREKKGEESQKGGKGGKGGKGEKRGGALDLSPFAATIVAARARRVARGGGGGGLSKRWKSEKERSARGTTRRARESSYDINAYSVRANE